MTQENENIESVGVGAVPDQTEKAPRTGAVALRNYDLTGLDHQDLKRRFSAHAPIQGQSERYQGVRERLRQTATFISRVTPKSREQSLALTKLEEAMFWANAAIARNEDEMTKTSKADSHRYRLGENVFQRLNGLGAQAGVAGFPKI